MSASRQAPASSRTRVISCEDGLAIAQIGPVCLVLWRNAVTQGRFERQSSAFAQIVARNPKQTGLLLVCESTAKPPDDKLRRASKEMILNHQDDLACVCCVIEGTGFKASVTRSALSSIALLMGNKKAPASYLSTVDEGAQWLLQYCEIPSVQGLTEAVESVRSLLPPFVPG